MAATEPAPNAPTKARTFTYRALFACALLAAAVAGGFFLVGIADGSVSAFNALLWSGLLAVVVSVPWASHALWSRGRTLSAIAVLMIVAGPALLFVLFALIVLIAQPHWQ